MKAAKNKRRNIRILTFQDIFFSPLLRGLNYSTFTYLFILFKFIYLNWRLITLQYCIGFAIHQQEIFILACDSSSLAFCVMGIYIFVSFFPNFDPVSCSMSKFNCSFLTFIQISQETSKVAWYSHFLKYFP